MLTKLWVSSEEKVKIKNSGVREMAHNTLVRPQLEYAAAVWDPHSRSKKCSEELRDGVRVTMKGWQVYRT